MLVPYARMSGVRKRGTHGEGTVGMGWGGAGWGRAACARVRVLTSSMPRGTKSVFVRRSYTGDTDIAPRLYFPQSPRATLPYIHT